MRLGGIGSDTKQQKRGISEEDSRQGRYSPSTSGQTLVDWMVDRSDDQGLQFIGSIGSQALAHCILQ